MASPNSSFASDVLSTTVQLLEGKPFDNIVNNTPLSFNIKRKGRAKAIDGGPSIVVPLSYVANSNYGRYSGSEQLPIAAQQNFTCAQYAWKQAAITFQITGLEDVQNSGRSQVADLMESRFENALTSATNSFDSDLWSAGTASDGKQIGGMQLLFADTETTGTVGGIDRSSWSFWRHYVYDASSDGGAAVSAANIYSYLTTILNHQDNREHPIDIIYMSNEHFAAFEGATLAIQRIVKEGEMAKAGFKAYAFRNGIECVLVGGLSSGAPSDRSYLIASDTLELRYFKGRNWTKLGGERQPVNQDVSLQILAWAGNLVSKGPRYNALLKG